jgi:hypothetical protein
VVASTKGVLPAGTMVLAQTVRENN